VAPPGEYARLAVPRLHQSDDLDARYHQLDNFTDRSSFDEHGTRLPSGPDLATARSLAAARRGRNASDPGPRSTTSTTTAAATTTTTGGRRPPATATRPAASRSRLADEGRREWRGGGVGLVSLAVTVGVGCGLLAVNAAVLAALHCKRGRLGKLRQQLAMLAPPGESAKLVAMLVNSLRRWRHLVNPLNSSTPTGRRYHRRRTTPDVGRALPPTSTSHPPPPPPRSSTAPPPSSSPRRPRRLPRPPRSPHRRRRADGRP